MANQDLTFTLLGRDRGASRVLLNAADAADHVSGRIGSLSAALLKLGGASGFGQVAGGLLAGLPAVAVAAGAAMGTLAVAVKGVGEAFGSTDDPEAYAEAMSKLSRSAQDFVISGRRVASGFTDIRKASNAEFFKPLTGVFDQLANRYYPTLARQLPALSHDLGVVSRSFADTVSSASAMESVGKTLQSSRTVALNLGEAVTGLASGFLRLAGAGGRFAENLTADLAGIGRAFDRFVARAAADGSLARMLDTASSSIRSLGQALAPVGQAVYNLFSSQGASASAAQFFTVLKAGSSVLATLINAFAALPPGIQSTIVTLGAAGLAASRMNNLLQAAGSGLTLTSIALGSLGSAGAKASAGVGAAAATISRAAGPVGIAVGVITALTLAFSGSSAAVKRVEIDMGSLSDSFKVFSATGKITGELAKQTGGSFLELAAKVRRADDELARMQKRDAIGGGSLGQALERKQRIEADIARAKGELDNVQSSVGAVAKQIADLARAGDIAGAASAATQFREAMLGQGKTVDWVNQQLQEYIGITGGATVAQYNVARGAQDLELRQRTLNGSWEDAINRLGGLTQAFDVLNGKFLSAREAELAAEEAAHRFGEAIKESGGKLNERTEKGRAAEVALIGMAKATEQATTKAYEQALATKSESDALAVGKKVWDEHRQQVIDAGIAAGMTRAEAVKLADQYLKMPPLVKTAVSAPGASAAASEVDQLREKIRLLEGKKVQVIEEGAPGAAQEVRRLQDEIDRLTGKTVYITSVERRIQSQTRGDTQVYEPRGYGGVDLKMGAGGTTSNFMSRWLRSPTILAGERGSEAYISSAAPPERSRRIIREAADMVGGPESIWPGAGGGNVAAALDRMAAALLAMSGRRQPVELTIASGQGALERLLVEVLRQAVQVRGGSVQTVLGSS